MCSSLATALLVVLLYTALLRRWRRSASKALPGPTGLSLVGSLPFLDLDLHTYFACPAAAHGPIFRIQLGIVISSLALAREVLKDQDAIFANRDVLAVAHVITYNGVDIVWNPNSPLGACSAACASVRC